MSRARPGWIRRTLGRASFGPRRWTRAGLLLPAALWVLLPLLLAIDGRAAAPTLEHLLPAGGAAGATHLVRLTGKFEPWPPRFQVQGEGLSVAATTNQNQIEITVAPGTPAGPRLLRAFNEEGASEPRIWVVGSEPSLAEAEPNDRFAEPQSVPALPRTIEGRLDKGGDVDSFAVALHAGEWLEARLDAFVLMSKIDAVLRLVDSRGVTLTWNHDTFALDPRLVWQAPSEVSVVVQVFGFRYPADASVTLGGGEGAVYRLHLRTSRSQPCLDTPPARPESETAADSPRADPERVLDLPVSVRGAVDSPTDEDRFRFRAAAGELLLLEVGASSIGSSLDAWIRIEDAAGKELAFTDDGPEGMDPRLEWKVPSDGVYAVVLGSRSHHGGSEHAYHLAITRPLPDFQARVTSPGFVVEAGSTNRVSVPVTVTRLAGHTNALEMVVRGLPEGITAAPVAAPAGNGEVTLQLAAAPGAVAFQGPMEVVLVEAGTRRERLAAWDLISTGQNNGVPQGWSRLLVERTDQLWLTVRAAAAKP